ncbi:MAG: response regulator [Proteobacteria bacterium]|nr:response regulator [Pseudomonadota bacterium]
MPAGIALLAQPRILVVEDEYLIAMMMENDLDEAGYNVVGIANSAEKAVFLATTEQPDLIIMDIRLIGGRDGIDAALEIFAKTGIRCLFATAHGDAQSKTRAIAASPLGWLQKPYGRAALIKAAREAVEQLKASRA